MRVVLACLLALLSFSPAMAAPPRPNVVLILTDDMGYTDLGVYRCKDIRTPNVDRLAKGGRG